MTRRVQYTPEARAQLRDLYAYLSERAGEVTAATYLDRLLTFCEDLALDPIVGHHRDDVVPGLLTRTFEKSRIVCFLLVRDTDVAIVAIYGARQDWERHLRDDPPQIP